jgi:glycosyltransferase involved in cell wall biosynthesis
MMMKVSVVIPCLNEGDTIAGCVRVAQQTLDALALDGEVVVADNGSTDESRALAHAAGARVVRVAEKGYGSALDGGIRASTGRSIVMGDADGSYDFAELGRFLDRLRAGDELVVGCRMPSGGGTIERGAMPFLHRWFGNPIFSLMTRWWFDVPIHDVNCGMRAFTRDLYLRIDARASGMSFAAEMIMRASLHSASVTEIPIAFRCDGRKHTVPHLRTFRDGWQILQMFLKLARCERSPARVTPSETEVTTLPR